MEPARVFVKIPTRSFQHLQLSHVPWPFWKWLDGINIFTFGCNKTAQDFRGSSWLPTVQPSFQVMCWPYKKGCTMRRVPWWCVYLGALLPLQYTGLDRPPAKISWKFNSIKQLRTYSSKLMERDYPRIEVMCSSNNNTELHPCTHGPFYISTSNVCQCFYFIILKIRCYHNLATHTHTDITKRAGTLHGTFMLHRDPVSVAWSSGNCCSTCLVLTDLAM